MSHMTVYLMPRSGELAEVEELKNAWGSAMRVWHSLIHAHLIDPTQDIDQQMGNIMFTQQMEPLWPLVKSPKLNRAERMVLGWTYDKSVCEFAKLKEMAGLFREFDKLHPVPGKVNHLPALAELYDRMADRPECLGLCVIQTSVCDDGWTVAPENEDDDYRMYDASKDEEHFFIFEKYDKDLEGTES